MKLKESQSPFGQLKIGTRVSLFNYMLEHLEKLAALGVPFTVGLTGGSSPKAFYRHIVEGVGLSERVKKSAYWSTSDERMVPLADEESNFGNADRMLLVPMNISEQHKFPWPVMVDPHSASVAFEQNWTETFGADKAFDLCMLGMGDDGHTASIFPNSPLLAIESNAHFSSVLVPDKGWRLSITPSGLNSCKEIIVLVTGSGKADRLKAVMEEAPGSYPVQILKNCASRVTWLVDEEAAEKL